MIGVEVIADSINAATGDRITTILAKYPFVIHNEFITHRLVYLDEFGSMWKADHSTPDSYLEAIFKAYNNDIPSPLSRNSSSSRAIPVKTMLQRAVADPWIPTWRLNQKGMQPKTDPVDEEVQSQANAIWDNMMKACVNGVRGLAELGIAKEIANRPLAWFGYMEVLITATEWKNFLLLRDHRMAQQEIGQLARAIRSALEGSTPIVLQPGQYHLPYSTDSTISLEMQIASSAARSARTTYLSFDTGKPSSLSEDSSLYANLCAGNPKHLSPLEHPARAEPVRERYGNFVGWQSHRKIQFFGEESGGDYQT